MKDKISISELPWIWIVVLPQAIEVVPHHSWILQAYNRMAYAQIPSNGVVKMTLYDDTASDVGNKWTDMLRPFVQLYRVYLKSE